MSPHPAAGAQSPHENELDIAIIVSNREQEYLLGAIEAAVRVRDVRQLFLWTQGQLQALLPHRLLLCIQLDAVGAVLRVDPVHAGRLDAVTLGALADPVDGLAARLAAHCRSSDRLPAISGAGRRSGDATLATFRRQLQQLGFDHLVVHGSGPRAGPATLFALCGWQTAPTARHAHFLALLLPHLHLALLKSASCPPPVSPAAPIIRLLSPRELEILRWIREGKGNFEIALILGLSPLTIKNHLQRIYRALGVSNRAHALAKSISLALI